MPRVKPIDRPNLVYGADVQVVWDKFCRYFEVEPRQVPLARGRYTVGAEVPLHVDAASGGFVFPFSHPDFEWDFRLESVKSINVSGHKFGLVYPGIGWLVFRDDRQLPGELAKINQSRELVEALADDFHASIADLRHRSAGRPVRHPIHRGHGY